MRFFGWPADFGSFVFFIGAELVCFCGGICCLRSTGLPEMNSLLDLAAQSAICLAKFVPFSR